MKKMFSRKSTTGALRSVPRAAASGRVTSARPARCGTGTPRTTIKIHASPSAPSSARGTKTASAGPARATPSGTAWPASRVRTPPRSSREAPAASARQETAASSGMGTSAFRSVRRPTTRGASAPPARRWIQVPRSGGTGGAAAARTSTLALRTGTGRSARPVPGTPPGTRWLTPVSGAAGRTRSE